MTWIATAFFGLIAGTLITCIAVYVVWNTSPDEEMVRESEKYLMHK